MHMVISKSNTARRLYRIVRLPMYKRIILAAALAFTLTALFSVCISNAGAVSPKQSYKYYTSVEIKDGESLISICDRYYSYEAGSMRDYMTEICLINHISSDMVNSGGYLIVPYYSYELFD